MSWTSSCARSGRASWLAAMRRIIGPCRSTTSSKSASSLTFPTALHRYSPPRVRNLSGRVDHAPQDVAFRAEVIARVIEARRVGEQQPVVLHLLRPPVA